MRHLEIRDSRLQKEVFEGKVVVGKVAGVGNPADLMTKVLGVIEIRHRLETMGLKMEEARDDAEVCVFFKVLWVTEKRMVMCWRKA